MYKYIYCVTFQSHFNIGTVFYGIAVFWGHFNWKMTLPESQTLVSILSYIYAVLEVLNLIKKSGIFLGRASKKHLLFTDMSVNGLTPPPPGFTDISEKLGVF